MTYSKGAGCGDERRVSRIGVATQRRACEGPVDATLDTLAAALYVTVDDLLKRGMT
jgi:hypothetical protein